MNIEKEKIAEAVRKMDELGIAIPQSARGALAELDNPVYKIGVVGRFQVGKSHLVNEAFLNQSLLLKEGAGLCTTAVTTEIKFGTVPKLTVSYKDGRPAKVVQNPQAEDIRAATSSTDPEKRKQMVADIESVTLEWPCEALKDFVVYDTAGIDDPNPDLLRLTTYRTIPQMDAAVMVTGAKALSVSEINFLRKNIFKYGIGRIIVLVSYNPTHDSLSAKGREELLEAIRAQLAEIGHSDISVKMVSYDNETEGVVNDPAAIRRIVQEFAEGAALVNRVSKVKMLLRKAISTHLQDLDFRRSLADKSESEIADIRKKYADIESEMKDARDEMLADFDGTIHAIKQEQSIRFRSQCKEVADRNMKGFEECDDLGEAQEYFRKVQARIVPEIESASVERFEAIRETVSSKLEEYSDRIQTICAKKRIQNTMFTPDIELTGGLCEKLNSSAVTIADYIVTILLLPGGLFMGWCLRFLAGQIPGVKNFTPAAIVKNHMVETVRLSLDAEIENTVESFKNNVGDALAALKTEIFRAVNEDIDNLANKAKRAAEAKTLNGEKVDVQKISNDIIRCGELLAMV